MQLIIETVLAAEPVNTVPPMPLPKLRGGGATGKVKPGAETTIVIDWDEPVVLVNRPSAAASSLKLGDPDELEFPLKP
jgi:hypothetical protein